MSKNTERELDAYDKAIAYLSEHPSEICDAWDMPIKHPAGMLFGFISEDRFVKEVPNCGCLVEIRSRGAEARRGGCYDAELTQEIKNDTRIPTTKEAIGVDTLPLFAAWQRRLDKELNRKPPVWVEPAEAAT
ncbi:MAG: hypothetical protein KGL39_34575 [Patescibacteria group bacterium]|nr:hypothetical protein [Patescibacteria group bacterium]